MHANILWTALNVAPLAGAWIEIVTIAFASSSVMVAPLAGAWIEIQIASWSLPAVLVAPLAGAWIEMISLSRISFNAASLPSRERGLKSVLPVITFLTPPSRSPRGSVD